MKKRNILILPLVLFFLLLVIPKFSLASIIQTNENITINEEINTNLYLVGGYIETNDYINGDLIAIGGTTNINSIVSGDITIISGESKLTKPTTRSAKIVSGSTIITENIDGDLIVIAGSVTIGENVEIKGDLIAIAQLIDIKGKIDGNVRIISTKASLHNCTVLGNASIKSNEIIFDNNFNVIGNLNYSSSDHIYQIEKHVQGNTNYKQIEEKGYFSVLSNKLWYGLTLIVIGIILIMVFPNFVQNSVMKINNQLGKTTLWGIICLILIPIIALILFITIIGIPLSLILIILYIISLYISPIFLALLVGSAIIPYKNSKSKKKLEDKYLKNKMLLSLLLGLLIYILITSIPLLGGAVTFITIVIGFGALILTKKELLQDLKNKKMI